MKINSATPLLIKILRYLNCSLREIFKAFRHRRQLKFVVVKWVSELGQRLIVRSSCFRLFQHLSFIIVILLQARELIWT